MKKIKLTLCTAAFAVAMLTSCAELVTLPTADVRAQEVRGEGPAAVEQVGESEGRSIDYVLPPIIVAFPPTDQATTQSDTSGRGGGSYGSGH
jgi:hypothetical protein